MISALSWEVKTANEVLLKQTLYGKNYWVKFGHKMGNQQLKNTFGSFKYDSSESKIVLKYFTHSFFGKSLWTTINFLNFFKPSLKA
ncbi:unnamed protein product [Blepharisma stoltei]|uniref:Uncharacterized protein n=1 Tax=Blepharisma stoltei TaxID=1481888 RepID=A0AAU9KDA2_9CILI|nr:unnamed protein product [Blepharisma stoltei]